MSSDSPLPIPSSIKSPSEVSLNELELQNAEQIVTSNGKFDYLYPSLDDPSFNTQIASRKEFFDSRYEGVQEGDIKEIAEKLCNAEFELAPHQMFVRNFMSFQTPYNGLLLYHGLGSGKTCSAISVAEEMRDYLKQMGITQRIIVVAAPNVQDNFKLQLFDERKLKLVDGIWNIRACTGNKYMKEINPMSMRGLSKERVINQVKRIINASYLFLGYIEFANYISKKSTVGGDMEESKRDKLSKAKLKKTFSNRLIIIDEVHNIRMTDDNKDKRVAVELTKLVETVPDLRLLLLSATPMYNSFKEIVWLINLLNRNDRRAPFSTKDVFNTDGSFRIDKDGREVGKELLRRKATGYVSFVRGENPYTFPFRIWPDDFSPENTYRVIPKPAIQLNGKSIIQPLDILSIYLTSIGETQQLGYNYIIEKLRRGELGIEGKVMPSFENMEAFGYTLLQRPLEALNIIYPDSRLESDDADFDPKNLVGKAGLARVMKYKDSVSPAFRGEFEYRSDKYGRIFSQEEIGKYSGKIANICHTVKESDGVVLVYSQYIDGGLVPIALALEEMGITRAGNNHSLFKKAPTPSIGVSYVMITGDSALSPDNVNDLRMATNPENKDGSQVKVILISQAGSEGLDFKFIRQVHILEPWYNMNRIEQIIGRAVRTCSHKDLPFEERNVELFLYGSVMENQREEAADVYVYRLAELKALQIGAVSRTLKESAVDCILNIDQTGFSADAMNLVVKQKLSNGAIIDFKVGDKPFTSTCDYMERCTYECFPTANINEDDIRLDSYNEAFITMNTDKIVQRIKELFKSRFYYRKDHLVAEITAIRSYPLLQINAALSALVEDRNEFVTDMYNRLGRVVNIGDLYLFQPIELDNKNISIYDRSVPVEYKRQSLIFDLPEEVTEAVVKVDKKAKKQREVKELSQDLLSKIREDYTTATGEPQPGTKEWLKNCSVIIAELVDEGYDKKMLNTLAAHHIIESLLFDDVISVLNLVEKVKESDEIVNHIKTYFAPLTMSADGITGIQLQNAGKQELIVKNRSGVWDKGQPEDYISLQSEIAKMIAGFMPLNKKAGSHIGFMSNFKKQFMTFKFRNVADKSSKGARCDQAGKSLIVGIINKLLGSDVFTSQTKKTREELCVLQEMTLRRMNIEKSEGKRWFLTPGEAILV
jgi:hypothetical protein